MDNNYKQIVKYFNGSIAIFCHINTDPDAICSAYALKNLIENQNKSAFIEIILPEGSNKLTKKIIKTTLWINR